MVHSSNSTTDRRGNSSAEVSVATAPRRLRTPAKEKFFREGLGRGFVTFMGIFIIALTLSILLFLLVRGNGTFTTFNHSLGEFLFSSRWQPSDSFDPEDSGSVGAAVFIVGSLITCGLAILITTPLALASAIFMTEISPKLGERVFRPAIEIFVGIPSVVYGWVGLTVLVPFIRDVLHGPVGGYSVLAAVIVLSVMIYPTITTMMADSFLSVPDSYREAAYGLGSTRWQVIKNIVIPASQSGIWTAIIMGLSRAFGEALAVSMVIGRARTFPKGILWPTNNITGIIASDMGDTINGSEYNMALWTLALLLMLISIIFILIIHALSDRQKKQLAAEKASLDKGKKAARQGGNK